jgi:hypothetical protein
MLLAYFSEMPHPRLQASLRVLERFIPAECVDRRGKMAGAERRALSYVTAGLCAAAIACNTSPSPPPMPQAVATLAAQYDAPTATLDPATARTIFEQTAPLRPALGSFTGLTFLRETLEDATAVEFDHMDIANDVQGSIEAHTACPGWENDPTPDDATAGSIDVTMGVENSKVQRAFAGHATECRFLAGPQGASSNVQATMTLEVDLGSDLGFGDPAPPILIRASNATIAVNDMSVDLLEHGLSFRLNTDGSVSTLIDPTTFGFGTAGTLLLTARPDGSWALRVRDGEWICSEGSPQCAFEPA